MDQLPGADPKVLVSMPVLILCTPQLHCQRTATHTAVLVYMQPFLKKPPTSVSDLCASFDLENLFRSWQFVRFELYIFGCQPAECISSLDTLFFVDDTVVKHIRHGSFVALSRVCAKSPVDFVATSWPGAPTRLSARRQGLVPSALQVEASVGARPTWMAFPAAQRRTIVPIGLADRPPGDQR